MKVKIVETKIFELSWIEILNGDSLEEWLHFEDKYGK